MVGSRDLRKRGFEVACIVVVRIRRGSWRRIKMVREDDGV